MEVMSDAELIQRATKRGDSAALRTLLDRHYHSIYAFAFKWCGHRQDAEDIAQEVCIKVARSLESFKGDSAFTSWLYRITANLARDVFRSRKARRDREAGYMDFRAMDEAEPTPEDNARRNEALNAVSALPDDLKATVLLVAGEGLSHKEAGAILNCAEGTVAWRMNKAKARLAHIMGDAS